MTLYPYTGRRFFHLALPVLYLLLLLPRCSERSVRDEKYWSRSYGAGGSYTVQDIGNAGEGFIIAGFITPSGGRGYDDVFAAKIGSGGDLLWTKRYGTRNDERVYSLQMIKTGFLLAGMKDSPGDTGRDLLVMRLDNDGDVVWSRVIGGSRDDSARVVRPDLNNYIVVGSTSSYGKADRSIWVLLLDGSGKVVWDRNYGDGSYNSGVDVVVEKDGYVIAGNSVRGDSGDVALFKIDRTGKAVWERILGGKGTNYAEALAGTRDGYVIAGYANRLPESDRDAWILRVDSRGNPLWSRTYGGKGGDVLYSVQATENGFIVSGSTNSWSESGGYAAWLFEVDQAGKVIWDRTYTQAFEARRVVPVHDGYIVAGNRRPSEREGGIWVMRCDKNGYEKKVE